MQSFAFLLVNDTNDVPLLFRGSTLNKIHVCVSNNL